MNNDMNSGTDPIPQPMDQARERIYIENARRLELQVGNLQRDVAQLQKQVLRLGRQAKGHGAQIDRLRLDRQILAFPRWLARKVKKALRLERTHSTGGVPRTAVAVSGRDSSSLLVVTPSYPSEEQPYGGQAIERRVRFYIEAGHEVTVFVPGPDSPEQSYHGVRVVRREPEAIVKVAKSLVSPQLCLHFPQPEVWAAVEPLVRRMPTHAWIHGYEARDWRELSFNYTAAELARRAARRDAINIERQKTLRDIFEDERVTKVFVSRYMMKTAETFAGVVAQNSTVIHNVIDTETFAHIPKQSEDRTRILVVRSFSRRNYATDLMAQTILRVSTEPWFSEIEFDIRGDGKHFEEDVADLRGFENVSITQGFISTPELVQLHRQNGVMLIPTRWDSQGMTMGEAMASGLVSITNAVAAIPEFADDTTAVLAPPNDVRGLAAGIGMLYREPDTFLELSRKAAERVRLQCSPAATIQRELDLFENPGRAVT